MLLPGLFQELTSGSAAASVQAALATPPANNVFIDLATKGLPGPYLVMSLVAGPPAGSTLDGTSDLIDGEIQFDSYAGTPQQAQKLSNAVRDFLMKTFNAGQLPDGTNVQFVDVTMDHNEPYEQGGTGYLYRRLLRLHAFFTEES
jgi:hypothetical protein